MSKKEALIYGYQVNGLCRIEGARDQPCSINDMTFVQSTYVTLCFLGMCVFACFGGVGLINIPFMYLQEFIYRPKPIDSEEFKKRTKILLPIVLKLRDKGKIIENTRLLVE